MKISTFVLPLLMLAGCASPSVSRESDFKSTSEVITLKNNSLDTVDIGTVYFNVEAAKTAQGYALTLITGVEYELQKEATIKLIPYENLVILIDDEQLEVKPNMGSYVYAKAMGLTAPSHIQSLRYDVDEALLQKMSRAKKVVVKLPAAPLKDNGFIARFGKINFEKLKEFLTALR